MNSTQARILTYVCIAVVMLFTYLAIYQLDWIGSTELHTIMETLAATLALFIGVMALVRFYSNHEPKLLIIGAGFVAVALLDAWHAVLTSNWLEPWQISEQSALIPWSWLTSRILLSLVFIACLGSSLLKTDQLTPGRKSKKLVYGMAISLVVLSILLLLYIPLPSGYFDNFYIYRPAELIPGILFIIALIGHIRLDKWRSDELEHWIIISLVLCVFTQVLYMPTSHELFDIQFDSSHILKKISYVCILCGLTISFFQDFSQMETEVNVRKLAQNALDASETRNRTLMSSLVDGLITISHKGIIENINTSACNLFGYSKLELLGKNIKNLMPEPNRSKHDTYLETYERTDLKHAIGNVRKVTGLKKNGTTFPIEITISEMIIKGSKKYSGILRDDTERQKAEEDIINSRNKAEIAAQAKTNFLATMSHEIRTPMNGVIGMVELLQDTELNENQKDIVNTISHSGHALVDLINDVLEISKIEAGKIEFHYTEFNLERLAYEIIKLLKPRADENSIELHFHYHSDCPRLVTGDAGRIRQILLNLIGNAIKFTHQGYVLVEIELTKNSNYKNSITFKIIDTGIGINREEKKKLFDSFTQADSSTSRKYGGTGLGLSICRQLINLMNGKLDVKSTLDKGSTFWFELEFKSTTSTDLPEAAQLKNINALIISEHTLNRKILSDHLLNWNMKVHETNQAQDAFELLSTPKNADKTVKLIILDKEHSNISIKNIENFIHSKNLHKNTPLIQLSQNGKNQNQKKATSQNNAAKINLPIFSDQLLKSIIIALNSSKEETHENTATTNRSIEKNTKTEDLNANILLAEDVLVNQKVALGILSKYNLKIDIADNGKKAVEKHQKNHYDLILMDCQMPTMDGYQATKLIRETDTTTPIIAITANALSTDREKCLASGMNDYIRKPYNREQLITSLLKWLKEKPGKIDLDLNSTRTRSIKPMKNTMTNSDKHINFDKLEEMKTIMGEVFNELIPAYLEQSDTYIEGMPEAINETSLEHLERYAHSMKSSSLNLGAERLSELAKQLEQMSKDKTNRESLQRQVEQTQFEYYKVKDALLEFQQRG